MDPNLPPSPTFQDGVWPPPPTVQGQPTAWASPLCPFKWAYRRAPGKAAGKANVADFREGYLQFDAEGVIIQAKAVPRAEIRALVLIPCFLLSILIAVVANAIMEYAVRSDQRLGVRWDSVREILLSPDKQQACLIYEAPNYAGKVKAFSLALTPTPGYYDVLAQAAQHYAATRVSEGRLKSATPLAAWILLGLFVAFLVVAVVFATLPPHH